MDFKKYTEEVVLANEATSRELSPSEFRLLHAALGIACEVLEGDLAETEDNCVEELGDLFWYVCLYLHLRELDVSVLYEHTRNIIGKPTVDDEALKEAIEELLSLTKKHIFYNKEQDLSLAITKVFQMLIFFVEQEGYNLEKILQQNREKLCGNKGRYREGYTQEEALNRRDKQNE